MVDGAIRFSIAVLLSAALAAGCPSASSFAGEAALNCSGVDQAALFRVAGAMYDLDPGLLKAIATVESNGRGAAVSPAGALGLMQLMPATARRFGVGDAFDPVDSVLGAARFLNHLRNRQRMALAFNLPTLIAAYNAGEGAVERHHGVPPYPETQQYVGRVLWRYVLDEPPRLPRGTAMAGTAVVRPPGGGAAALLNQLARLRRERARAQRAALIDGSAGRED